MSGKTGAVFLLFATLSLLSCGADIVVLSYNVENLFDDRSDGGEYPEYRGDRWPEELYARKLSSVARAVKAAARRGPDILCLQEIESERALRDLRDRHLASFGYRYLVFVPHGQTITSVACLSRIPVARTRVHRVGTPGGAALRPILELELVYEGSTLYVFNNHWKSKSGGVEQTAPARREAAQVLAARLRQILRVDPAADILVVGDLNENLDEHARAGGRYATATAPAPETGRTSGERDALFVTPEAQRAGLLGERVVLYEPWFELDPEQRGSAVYMGRWQTPDRILLSPGLFDNEGFVYYPGNFRVLRAAFLVDPESGFPRRWSHDPSGAGRGTSDHLPLVLSVQAR
jgi:endonuclease/exonuclease/phosphatase family metal-dependent hydrolase